VTSAERLLDEGRVAAAAAEVRAGLRHSRDSPELWLLRARLDLARDDGGLARIALERARQAGASTQATLPLRAEAHLAAKDYFAVLDLPVQNSYPRALKLQLLSAKGRAAVAMTPEDPARVFTIYRALFTLLQDIPAGETPSALEREMTRHLRGVRARVASVERAYAHVDCAAREREAVQWQPANSADPTLRVGPDRSIQTIAEAAAQAEDGDVVAIDGGTYAGGVAKWPQNDLIVRGVRGRAHITAQGHAVEGRDVWLFTGNNVVVENVEISGARSPRFDNGAGIRFIGKDLTLRHVYLHHNEMGVLTGNRHSDSKVLIEFSEFAHNGTPEGEANYHNIYIGVSGALTLRFSYSHDGRVGHLVKSRAQHNRIEYNRLTDESGAASYIVDVPNGGTAEIIGNVIDHGASSPNRYMISFGGEGLRHEDNSLRVVNNTIFNRRLDANVVHNFADAPAELVNNIVAGAPVGLLVGAGVSRSNWMGADHGLIDPRHHDYGLRHNAEAIDAGEPYPIEPTMEYVHPVRGRPRLEVWRIDLGAREACLGPRPPASAADDAADDA